MCECLLVSQPGAQSYGCTRRHHLPPMDMISPARSEQRSQFSRHPPIVYPSYIYFPSDNSHFWPYLFLIGLTVFLFKISWPVAIPVTCAIACTFTFLAITTALPALQLFPVYRSSDDPSCVPSPYRFPQSLLFSSSVEGSAEPLKAYSLFQ